MKTRSVLAVLAVMAASLVVAGCGEKYKKMHQDTLVRAEKAEQQQAQTAQELEKVKAEKARLETSVQTLSRDVAALRKTADDLQATARKANAALEAAIKEKKDVQDQLNEVAKSLTSLKAQVQEKDAKIAQLDQANKGLQQTVEKIKAEAAAKAQSATGGAGAGAPQR
jgi:archaellum component FlaC